MEKAECQHAPICAIPYQHGPTLQFVSSAKKTAFLEQSWWPEFDMFGSMPWCSLADANELLYSLQSKFDRWVYIRVFAEGDLDRTTEAIVPMIIMNERLRKLNANMHQCVPLGANMGQHCSLSAVQRRQPFWNSHDGLNLTCLDQCHGVRWLTPTNCYTVYSLNLIDEFASLFSPKVIVAGLPRESFPHAFVDISVIVWLCTRILPRLAQGLFSNERTC